ncbi:MAG: hypothetical protein A2151_03815 [Candidatus Muproteobacteria bacterium RBG_16_65_34]|uniref:Flagellar biosynthesis protein FlhB n=1 Tax=Candidatus Muproteobacteria bacterium RBG_16_65_34 TaxID=1817760 RepID=A0A1F6TVR1_9PROT|nr:MAG: hypothetical protein A2151_03815 [Candidatus Muproteobacteria bacterium RBG_16_65_34]
MSRDDGKPPQTEAFALHYGGRGAPRVTASGKGYVAEEILAAAKKHGVPLYEDANLARLLARVELGDEVPRALYVAVAKVIAFAYLVRGKAPNSG